MRLSKEHIDDRYCKFERSKVNAFACRLFLGQYYQDITHQAAQRFFYTTRCPEGYFNPVANVGIRTIAEKVCTCLGNVASKASMVDCSQTVA